MKAFKPLKLLGESRFYVSVILSIPDFLNSFNKSQEKHIIIQDYTLKKRLAIFTAKKSGVSNRALQLMTKCP